MCTECKNQPRPAPAALADIECRLDSLRSIASCVLECCPARDMGGSNLMFYLNETSNLTAAMIDLLELCRDDVKRAYKQMEQVD